jgi:hypothetical protein|tara:strand:- start:129 stop:557 length:429 start_codon:yes stop_codon:yes gene_type:complete
MESFILLFADHPEKTFAYITLIVTTICFVSIGASYYYDYIIKNKFLNKIEGFDRSLKDLVEEFRSFELLFSEQKGKLDEFKFNLNSMEQEISRLADSLNSDKNITAAISLAKEGLSVSEISKRTGIPIEEVEPIVRYHGNNN